ncbi:MAG: hypothetical protein R3E68_11695 [Burkholderiaceae bacterium]
MTLLVDTSVWSLALRRDGGDQTKEVIALRDALKGRSPLSRRDWCSKSCWGFSGPKAREAIIDRFGSLPLIQPDRQDHRAAEVRNLCRRNGVQIGTIDALLLQLCSRHELTLLSSDRISRMRDPMCRSSFGAMVSACRSDSEVGGTFTRGGGGSGRVPACP